MKNLKEKLSAGEAVHGCWLNSGSAINAEIVSKAGFDWVTIDLEHGVGTENHLLYQLQALSGNLTVPLVRVEALAAQRVKRVLDLGAKGVLFPLIQNKQEAEQAASFMRYPPDGIRGMATMTRATNFGHNFDQYYKVERHDLVSVIQIETVECLNNVDEIAKIDGIDVLFVGPADLTLSLGIFKQFEHPKYLEALNKVSQATANAGKSCGILMSNPDDYEKYFDLGYRMIGCGSDSVFLNQGAYEMAKALNDHKN